MARPGSRANVLANERAGIQTRLETRCCCSSSENGMNASLPTWPRNVVAMENGRRDPVAARQISTDVDPDATALALLGCCRKGTWYLVQGRRLWHQRHPDGEADAEGPNSNALPFRGAGATRD